MRSHFSSLHERELNDTDRQNAQLQVPKALWYGEQLLALQCLSKKKRYREKKSVGNRISTKFATVISIMMGFYPAGCLFFMLLLSPSISAYLYRIKISVRLRIVPTEPYDILCGGERSFSQLDSTRPVCPPTEEEHHGHDTIW